MKPSGLALAALLLAACAATGPTQGELIAESLRATVQLATERDGGGQRSGSAVVLSIDGTANRAYFLTSAHLLEPLVEQSVRVTDPAGGDSREAKIVAVDSDLDLAVLETDRIDARPVPFAGEAQLGDGVWVVGFPWGRERTLVNGAVSQVATAGQPPGLEISGPVRLIDAPVSYGTSGGGVFDRKSGKLLGVVRGYRTVRLSLPGTENTPVNLPVAGETTVIPTSTILCFLDGAKLRHLVPGEEPSRGDGCSLYGSP